MASLENQQALQEKFNDQLTKIRGTLTNGNTLNEDDKKFLQTLVKSWGSKLTRLVSQYKADNQSKELNSNPLFLLLHAEPKFVQHKAFRNLLLQDDDLLSIVSELRLTTSAAHDRSFKLYPATNTLVHYDRFLLKEAEDSKNLQGNLTTLIESKSVDKNVLAKLLTSVLLDEEAPQLSQAITWQVTGSLGVTDYLPEADRFFNFILDNKTTRESLDKLGYFSEFGGTSIQNPLPSVALFTTYVKANPIYAEKINKVIPLPLLAKYSVKLAKAYLKPRLLPRLLPIFGYKAHKNSAEIKEILMAHKDTAEASALLKLTFSKGFFGLSKSASEFLSDDDLIALTNAKKQSGTEAFPEIKSLILKTLGHDKYQVIIGRLEAEKHQSIGAGSAATVANMPATPTGQRQSLRRLSGSIPASSREIIYQSPVPPQAPGKKPSLGRSTTVNYRSPEPKK